MTFLHFLGFVGTLSLHCSNSESLGHLESETRELHVLRAFLSISTWRNVVLWKEIELMVSGLA